MRLVRLYKVFFNFCPLFGLLILANKGMGFPGGSDGKESACNVGDLDSTPESGRSPVEGKGYPLQYSYLENFICRGDWWVFHGITKSQM